MATKSRLSNNCPKDRTSAPSNKFLLALFLCVLAPLCHAQIGGFLAPSPQTTFSSQSNIVLNFSDSKWIREPVRPIPFTVNVVSNGYKSHQLLWNDLTIFGSVRIAIPPSSNRTDFIPRGIELVNELPYRVYVVGDLTDPLGIQPVVIPFIYQNGSFSQQPIQYLVDNPFGTTPYRNHGTGASLAQNHHGLFISSWVTDQANVMVRRFQSTLLPPYMAMTGLSEEIPAATLGLFPPYAVFSTDVAMNESDNFKLALWVSDLGPTGSIKVYSSNWSSPTVGYTDLLVGNSGAYKDTPISIAMRTKDGEALSTTMPSYDQDYAVIYAEESPQTTVGALPSKIFIAGSSQGTLQDPVQVNPTPEEQRAGIALPQIDAGPNFYEVVWNYSDVPLYIPSSGGTWEMLSQGISADLQLIGVGANGNPGHKCISDTHGDQQFGASVAIASQARLNRPRALYSYGSIVGPGVALNPTNFLNPSPGSAYFFTYKHLVPGNY